MRRVLLAPAAYEAVAGLREKGGLYLPRLEAQRTLVWPGEREERVDGLERALRQDFLIMSRETARLEHNQRVLLAAEPWDLVLVDEAHAARRREQVEGEFNSANLLLGLLRNLQFTRQARSRMLLSATPMQTSREPDLRRSRRGGCGCPISGLFETTTRPSPPSRMGASPKSP